jgi:hydroxyacylglutathione hydrolase
MILKRFYDETLAQASYLVGCDHTGDAIIIDPNRDVEQYVAAATAEKVRIVYVTETHIHADFVSGSRELARHTGATLLLSDEGGPDWRYRYATAEGATLLHDGDTIDVGRVRITVLHTPGHTPEHLTFLVTDRASANVPVAAITGDFIFAGDVGRPDLLERAANIGGTMEASARLLFRSLQRFKRQPEYLQLWPGHGAGSACGKALGAVPSTTLGYERIANWAFGIDDEEEFVRQVLEGQPEPPRYFATMKHINRDGPSVRGGGGAPTRASLAMVERAKASGAWLVDIRPTPNFIAGHMPGFVHIPLNKSYTNWMGSLVPYDRDVVLLAESESAAMRGVKLASLIGLDRIIAWCGTDQLEEYAATRGPLSSVAEEDITVMANGSRATTNVVDVRAQSEWDGGHIPGASHRFLGKLLEQTRELPRDEPVAVHCAGGSRSAIAASLLEANGFTNVTNLRGGFGAWKAANLPVVVPNEENE